ncbi:MULTISPECIES: hypothetical protein [unclassified Microbacterium]|uniref:hypothetical protein n=1 Tax=unclassified Microbacterium TaxID=2609290 RepID=UPI0016052C95|nr:MULTISPECIES: hypothetical protein [unclassified Microbacterium]QNA92374.1 hypothetical protein G4G29_08295 [Microbacterium sp. Se63.02b]QYM65658.1 hypothetical protein K1X59_08340 [Microbacterium sp. Se5.02b]
MVERGARRRYRREWRRLALAAPLFAFIVGLLLQTLTSGIAYSVLQWTVIGMIVAGSAVLLVWQALKVRSRRRRLRDR